MCLFLDPYCLLCVFYSVLESISTTRINRKPCVWKWTSWHAAEGFYPWRVHKFGAQEWPGNVSFQLSFIIGCICEIPVLDFSWIIIQNMVLLPAYYRCQSLIMFCLCFLRNCYFMQFLVIILSKNKFHHSVMCAECFRRNLPYFWRMFLWVIGIYKTKHTKRTFIQSWTLKKMMKQK